MKKKILVLYHKNCLDGFGGAFAAWKKFGDRAEYIAVNPETLPEKFPVRREIYAIDISYPVAIQKKLRQKNASFVILDHHAGMEADTRYFPENVFDNNHSGAVIAWKYFHSKKRIPKLLLHIEDIDLWKWRMRSTREVISSLTLLDYNFPAWERFLKNVENPRKRKLIVRDGKLLSFSMEKIIRRLVESATTVSFEGMRIQCVNSPIFASEIANKLVEKVPPVGIVWAQRGNTVNVSLRSDGTVDVSKLAKKYGGGGHARASGFVFDANGKVPWKMIKNK